MAHLRHEPSQIHSWDWREAGGGQDSDKTLYRWGDWSLEKTGGLPNVHRPHLHGTILQILRCHVTPLPLCLCAGYSPAWNSPGQPTQACPLAFSFSKCYFLQEAYPEYSKSVPQTRPRFPFLTAYSLPTEYVQSQLWSTHSEFKYHIFPGILDTL